jgi:hypothetical protein
MTMFPNLVARAGALALLLGAVALLGGGMAMATTVPFTPVAADPGAVELNTVISLDNTNTPGLAGGGTLSFNLTLGANYDPNLGANAGANGSFNMQLDAGSNVFWSGAFLSAAPSTPGSTSFGDFTNNNILASGAITDISLWTVGINPGDVPVLLTLFATQFSGYCPGASTCFPPNATFSYDFTPTSTGVTPLPAALPLFATGMGLMGWAGWRRKRGRTVEA